MEKNENLNENFRIEDQIIYILISWDVVCGEINWTFFPLYLSFIYQKKKKNGKSERKEFMEFEIVTICSVCCKGDS